MSSITALWYSLRNMGLNFYAVSPSTRTMVWLGKKVRLSEGRSRLSIGALPNDPPHLSCLRDRAVLSLLLQCQEGVTIHSEDELPAEAGGYLMVQADYDGDGTVSYESFVEGSGWQLD